jgi:hypothetical protein
MQSIYAVQIHFMIGKYVIIVTKKENVPTIDIPIYLFTKAGSELLKLITPDPPFNYLTKFEKKIKRENVEVKYGFILNTDPTHFSYTKPLLDFPE